jgi:hypothetical protein
MLLHLPSLALCCNILACGRTCLDIDEKEEELKGIATRRNCIGTCPRKWRRKWDLMMMVE